MKGHFITFEGVEGCGKSTQIKLLAGFLKREGADVVVTREPGGTAISDKIRALLLDPANKEMKPETELLLYAASRSQHVLEKILPAIKSGKIVISDRFYDSTIAYQGVARGIDRKFIDQCIDLATGGLKPDITFVLDIPVEVGQERVKERNLDRMEREDIVFHKRVRDGFLKLAIEEPDRIVVVDANCEVEDLQKKIRDILKEHLNIWR